MTKDLIYILGEYLQDNRKIVSAVVPFYGDPTDTLALVDQLKGQTMADSIEIIVSDDCSPIPFPEVEGVRVVRREANGGFGANVNSGVAKATGKWLFILNSDLSLKKDFIERAVAKAESLGDVLLAPQILGHDGKSQYVGRKFPTTFHITWEWLSPFAAIRSTDLWHRMVGHDLSCADGATVEVDWVMGACMVLQTETYRRIGGMDERFFMNSEEVDLQYRLFKSGIKRIFAGDLKVEHIGGASSGDYMRRRQWVLDSRYIYADKWETMKNLHTALTLATYFNYLFNKVRSLRNAAVDAKSIRTGELLLIKTAKSRQNTVAQQYPKGSK